LTDVATAIKQRNAKRKTDLSCRLAVPVVMICALSSHAP
jgi:hypothetical protein